ncbi:O-antigen ligase family protein [Putridiphycobacter roseus]|nr:O-antigen ligase family protein [Putridiphycobacter roseus]
MNSKYFISLFTLVTFLICIYAYSPYIENYAVTPKWLGFALICIGLSFKKPKKTTFDLTHLIWGVFVLQFMVSALSSYNIWDSLIRTTPLILAPIAATLLFQKWHSIKRKFESIALLLTFCLVPLLIFAFIKIYFLWQLDDFNHNTTYQFAFNFGHRNQFAQFLTLSIPFFFLGLTETKTTWKKWVLLMTLGLTYILITLLMCRSVLLVIYVIYPLLIFLYYLQVIKKISLKLFISFFLPLLLISLVFVLTNPFHFSWIDRLFETNFGSGNERLRIWTNTFAIIQENPIFGVGSGDWKIEILKTPLAFTQAEDSLVFFQRAHNDFIQIAAENGLVGLTILLLFFFFVFRKLLKTDLKPSVKYSIAGGMLGFILIANFSFPFEKIELLFLLLFLIQFIPGKPLQIDGKILSICRLMLSIIFLVTSLYWYQLEAQYFTFKQYQKIQILKSLNQTFYSIDPTGMPVHWYLGNDLYQRQHYKAANKEFKTALKHNPYHVHILNNIGSTYLNLNEIDSAKVSYQKALIINPIFTETLMNYAALEFNNGNIDGALDKILKVRIDKEPQNYKTYATAIGQVKMAWLIELWDEEGFENFLIAHYKQEEFAYEIAINARKTGASYEDELRLYYAKENK